MNRSSLGKFGEEIAFKYLLNKGLTPKQRNFRAGRYEIDLIMEDSCGCIVFIEVKTRRSEKYGMGREAVGWRKQANIIAAAESYIYENDLYERKVRFDVVEVDLKNNKITHIADAFET